MAAQAPAMRIRALTLMDVLDESFRIYRANFPLLAGLAVLIAIPSLAIQLLSGTTSVLTAYYNAVFNGASSSFNGVTGGNPFIAILQYPVSLALLPFEYGALYAAAVAIILGRPATIWSVIRSVLRRYWALLVLSFLYGLSVAALFCPPLGIWLLTKLSMLFATVFTEEASMGTAIERTWRLTNRAFWRTFAVLLLSYLLAAALQYSLGTVFLALAVVLPGLPVEVRIFLLVAVVTLMAQLVQPLFSIAVTLLYFDLRVRREAFDLEVMAYQLSTPEGSRS
jgi:hypothetical protein